jgi:hypothetical protein
MHLALSLRELHAIMIKRLNVRVLPKHFGHQNRLKRGQEVRGCERGKRGRMLGVGMGKRRPEFGARRLSTPMAQKPAVTSAGPPQMTWNFFLI